MSTRLNPYIAFDGNAKEAMEFYRDVFGGSLNISTFGEFGNDDPAVADKTMHAMLETDNGLTLMASDGPPGAELTPRRQHHDLAERGRRRGSPGLLEQALRRRLRHDAPREADVGGRVRHVRRPVRDPVDGRHRAGVDLGRSDRQLLRVAPFTSRPRRDQQVDGAADRQTECRTTDHVERKVAPTYIRATGTNPESAASAHCQPSVTDGRATTVRAAETAACPDGKPRSPSSTPLSWTSAMTPAGRSRPMSRLQCLRRQPGGGPADPDRECEARPIARVGEHGRCWDRAERSVLHR